MYTRKRTQDSIHRYLYSGICCLSHIIIQKLYKSYITYMIIYAYRAQYQITVFLKTRNNLKHFSRFYNTLMAVSPCIYMSRQKLGGNDGSRSDGKGVIYNAYNRRLRHYRSTHKEWLREGSRYYRLVSRIPQIYLNASHYDNTLFPFTLVSCLK